MPSKEKRRYISYRVDAYLRDKFITSRKQKPRECCGAEGVVRFLNHVKFCVVCCASLGQAVAPWMLCAVEVLAVLLIYFLGTSKSLLIHEAPGRYHFSYRHSIEDIVGLSCTRAALLSLAYAMGQRTMQRPYLCASYLLVLTCFPYLIVKTILYRYSRDAVAAAAIFTICGLFTWFHVFAARRTVDWAKRRYQMGLGGFGMPWEEGEDAWLMLKRPDLEDMTKTSDGGGPDSGDDVPAEALADLDSQFVDIGGLKVHYKEQAPPPSAQPNSTVGIVLVHGFGGGVFAWRHVMEALAMQCRCRVIAFDRPGFGLTARPRTTTHTNPYTIASQSDLVLQLCAALGLRQVLLVAHADGCLVTLRAASTSVGALAHLTPPPPPQPHPRPVRAAYYYKGVARTAPSSAGSSPRPMSASTSVGTGLDQIRPPTVVFSPQAASTIDAQMFSCCNSLSGEEQDKASYVSAGGATRSTAGVSVISSGSPTDAEAGSLRGDANVELDRAQPVAVAAAAIQPAPQQQQQQLPLHRRAHSMPGPASVSAQGPCSEVCCTLPHQMPAVLGLVLLHPNLSGVMGPAFSRILARSKLGRSILRPLLRTEIGEVANRRAWHNTDKLTTEVLELYKMPLRVEGWDSALMEITRQRKDACQGDLPAYYGTLQPVPSLIITGQHDRIMPPSRSESLAMDMPLARLSILPDCGHLSHEEAPGALLEQLVPFCGEVLTMTANFASGTDVFR